MPDPYIIEKAAIILDELSQKPLEQTHFTYHAIPVLNILKERGLVTCHLMSNLPEQNIWTLTPLGLSWLRKHGL